MSDAKDFSIPMLDCRDHGKWRFGSSKFTVPVFTCVLPAGNIWFKSALFTTGPFTRNGFVGRRPFDGPGSTLVAEGQIGAVGGPHRFTRNELETAPAETNGVKFEYAVFWKYSPHPPRMTVVLSSSSTQVAPTRGERLFLSTG